MNRTQGRVFLQYHTYYVMDDIALEALTFLRPRDNGLIAVVDDGLSVYCGTHTGDVYLTLELHDDPPPADVDAWDDVVEANLVSTTGQLKILGMMATRELDFPNPAFTGPGHYRIRVSARGRDRGEEFAALSNDDEPVEAHMIQIWSAPAGPTATLKATDETGKRWRSPAE